MVDYLSYYRLPEVSSVLQDVYFYILPPSGKQQVPHSVGVSPAAFQTAVCQPGRGSAARIPGSFTSGEQEFTSPCLRASPRSRRTRSRGGFVPQPLEIRPRRGRDSPLRPQPFPPLPPQPVACAPAPRALSPAPAPFRRGAEPREPRPAPGACGPERGTPLPPSSPHTHAPSQDGGLARR